jgi:hypothetical protein
MINKDDTIGIQELMDEIDKDVADYKARNAGDYSVKNVVMFWQLERERVLIRHLPATLVKKARRARSVRFWLGCFSAAWAALIAVQALIGLLMR